jgi:hypothetical protein
MKLDFRKEFDRLFGLVSDREKKRNDHRLEKQALRIKRSLSDIERHTPMCLPNEEKPKNNFYGGIGEYTLLK